MDQYSIPRAVSGDGRFVVTTSVADAGTAIVFTLRRTDGTAGVRTIAKLTDYSTDDDIIVSVSTSGSEVVYGLAKSYRHDADHNVLRRWHAADGSVTDVVTPAPTMPPGPATSIVYPRQASVDGQRIVWTQLFYGSTPNWIDMVTDARTDAVITEVPRSTAVPNLADALSSGDHFSVLNVVAATLLDVDSGEVIDLGPAAALAVAQYPGDPFLLSQVSDDGRYVVFHRMHGVPGDPYSSDTVRFDTVTSVVTPVLVNHPISQDYIGDITVMDVANSGDVLLGTRTDVNIGLMRLSVVGLDGMTTNVASSGYIVSSTADLRTVVVLRQLALGYELDSSRCV